VEKVGLKYPQPLLNWTTREDNRNLLQVAGFVVVVSQQHLLLPKHMPLLSRLTNRYLAHLPGLNSFCPNLLDGCGANGHSVP